jgi:hypothetical protein
MWSTQVPILKFGTAEQKARYLPVLVNGDLVAAHAITEEGSGSDAFNIRTSATKRRDRYIISGSKTFITNAPVAGLFILFASVDRAAGAEGISAFLLEKDAPGFSVSNSFDKMGLRTSPMAEIVLDDCFVPESATLGRRGQGGEIFTTSMRWERACIMASQVGLMRRTMETCVRYAKERRQFGKPIAKYESIADKIANMRIAVDASRGLVLRVGWLMDQGRDAMVEAAIAKVFVSEANVQTHVDALQIHGGYGYMTEFEIERPLRDALASTIYSGTSEIQRRIIARGLGL